MNRKNIYTLVLPSRIYFRTRLRHHLLVFIEDTWLIPVPFLSRADVSLAREQKQRRDFIMRTFSPVTRSDRQTTCCLCKWSNKRFHNKNRDWTLSTVSLLVTRCFLSFAILRAKFLAIVRNNRFTLVEQPIVDETLFRFDVLSKFRPVFPLWKIYSSESERFAERGNCSDWQRFNL